MSHSSVVWSEKHMDHGFLLKHFRGRGEWGVGSKQKYQLTETRSMPLNKLILFLETQIQYQTLFLFKLIQPRYTSEKTEFFL